MHRSSIFMAIVAGFGVFVFFSVDVLRELYGPSALLAIYGVVAIFTTLAVYSVVERMYSINSQKSKDNSLFENNESEKEVQDDSEDEVVDKEVESLRQQS